MLLSLGATGNSISVSDSQLNLISLNVFDEDIPTKLREVTIILVFVKIDNGTGSSFK